MKMKYFRNIKIKTKLLLLGLISIIGLISIGTESAITAKQMNEASTKISKSWIPAIIIAEELNTKTSDYRNKEYNHVISKDEKDMDLLERDMNRLREEIDADFKEYELYVPNASDREFMDEAEEYWNQYLDCSDRLLAASRANKTVEAHDLILGQSKQLFQNAGNGFLKVVDYDHQGSEAASYHVNDLFARLIRIKIITIVLIAAAVLLLVIFIILAIDKPVKAIMEGIRKVVNGDLDVYLPYYSKDEIGTLTSSVNQLIGRLKNIINDEKYMLREIGSQNFLVKSTCEQAYKGDFSSILYSITSLASRLETAKKRKDKGMTDKERAKEEKKKLAMKAACKEIKKHDSRTLDASDKES